VFTTGSKLFVGASALAVIAAVAVGVTTGGAVGITATISLIGVALAFGLLAGVNFHIRDGNVPSMVPDVQRTAAAAEPPASRSVWPFAGAVSGATIAVGAVTYPVVFKLGVLLALATIAEWTVRAWSERASASNAYNDGVRKRILHPLEFPVLGTIVAAVVIYSFSRIMLWIDKDAGPWAFLAIGAVVMIGGFVIAARPTVRTAAITVVLAVATLGLVSVGAVAALDGQREISDYPTTIDYSQEICVAPGEVDDPHLAEIDERASQTVSDKAATAGTVVLEDGELRVYPRSIDQGFDTITVPKGLDTTFLFRNLDEEHRRFTINMGQFTTEENGTAVVETPMTCTSLLEHGGETALTFKLPKPSSVSEAPYTIVVPGIEGQQIEIVVP
jgi:hypothetical protein